MKRSIMGIIIFLVTAGFIALRYVSTLFFDMFILLIILEALFEVTKLRMKTNKYTKYEFYFAFIYVYISYLSYLISKNFFLSLLYQLLLFVIFFVISMIVNIALLNRTKEENRDESKNNLFELSKNAILLMLYPTTLMGSFYAINLLPINLGSIILITVFAVTMLCDVFAFAFGSLLKGKKLCPLVSPNKTISGAVCGVIGGLIGSLLSMVLFYNVGLLGDVLVQYELANLLFFFIGLGIIGSMTVIFGDLLSSSIKRKYGVKDYNNLLPGHGGIMDRINGLMFCATLAIILAILFL